jgi:uncharacterized membrane protein
MDSTQNNSQKKIRDSQNKPQDPQKKILFGILLITIFIFMVALSSLYVQFQIDNENVCGCLIPVSLFIPLLACIGLFMGTLIYYLISPRFEAKKIDTGTLLKLLDADDSKLISIIISNKGEISQSKLGKMSGMSKVKVFRTIENLKRKGIVEKSPHGKTNMIRLGEEFRELFL